MKKLILTVIAAIGLLAVSAGVASAENPHCAGSSDNINLPSGHVNNHPACN